MRDLTLYFPLPLEEGDRVIMIAYIIEIVGSFFNHSPLHSHNGVLDLFNMSSSIFFERGQLSLSNVSIKGRPISDSNNMLIRITDDTSVSSLVTSVQQAMSFVSQKRGMLYVS